MTLIALCADAPCAGKSEVAKYLCQTHGFQLIKFAGPLKNMTRSFLASLGFNDEDIEDRVEGALKEVRIPGVGVSTRQIMQTLGTEWGRECISPSLWTDITRSRLYPLLAAGEKIVIDDLRFRNEYNLVLGLRGSTFKVQRRSVQYLGTHASEGELKNIDLPVIDNKGTLADLHSTLDSLVSSLAKSGGKSG